MAGKIYEGKRIKNRDELRNLREGCLTLAEKVLRFSLRHFSSHPLTVMDYFYCRYFYTYLYHP